MGVNLERHVTVEVYRDQNGRKPFDEWVVALKDKKPNIELPRGFYD